MEELDTKFKFDSEQESIPALTAPLAALRANAPIPGIFNRCFYCTAREEKVIN